MELLEVTNLRMIDRNVAAGEAIFVIDGREHRGELLFYLQSDYCVGIRANRCGPDLKLEQIEEYIINNKSSLKRFINPQVQKLRQEQREAIAKLYED